VGVAVDEPRDDGFPFQINDPRSWGGMSRHCRFRADRYDPIASDGDRLRDREGGIDGDDLGVLENQIGRTWTG